MTMTMTRNPKMAALFVYGTLTEKTVQEEIIGRAPEYVRDTLHNHRLSQTEMNGRMYPAADAHKGGKIDGLVLFITEAELEKIDDYETGAYERIRVRLKSGNRAWVYVKSPH